MCLLYDVDRFALIWVFLTILGSRNVLQFTAKRVDDLGDELRPVMRKGWLAYIKKTYVADADHYDVAIGQDGLVVPDDV